jgi:hypothetical protein
VPVEFDFGCKRWGKAEHALLTANDRFLQISLRHPEKSVAWAEARAAQSEFDAGIERHRSQVPRVGLAPAAKRLSRFFLEFRMVMTVVRL